ncbi:hypothetical protein M3Y99_00354400 [Aphelenchoides fujianensis]|nr:hypothetical protein M3Y99_00354400 [Aphelenchoides fujianensis]
MTCFGSKLFEPIIAKATVKGRVKKTRKFRNNLQQKRIIKETDSRIKKEDRVIRKKKENEQELKVTKV